LWHNLNLNKLEKIMKTLIEAVEEWIDL